jgi:hypothetical protein
MNNENIKEYMKHVCTINKDLAEYVNEDKGVKYIIPMPHLLCRIEYIEPTENEYKRLLFEQKIEKLEYKTKMAKRPVVKSTITHDKKDDTTLVDSELKVYEIWNVTNGLGLKKSFTSKEEAIKLYDEVNSKVLKDMEV